MYLVYKHVFGLSSAYFKTGASSAPQVVCRQTPEDASHSLSSLEFRMSAVFRRFSLKLILEQWVIQSDYKLSISVILTEEVCNAVQIRSLMPLITINTHISEASLR